MNEILSNLDEIDDPLILDVGCGTGFSTISIYDHFSGNVKCVSIDIS